MRGRFSFALAFALLAALAQICPAAAGHPDECAAAGPLAVTDIPLPNVERALGAKHFDILVVGAGSSALPGPNGVANAYPARLQHALIERAARRRRQGDDGRASQAHRRRHGEDAAGRAQSGQARADDLADRDRRRDAGG